MYMTSLNILFLLATNYNLFDLLMTYLGLTLLATCIGDIMTGSFKGRGNQYILVGQDSALLTVRHQ